jgi:hypothetical protein
MTRAGHGELDPKTLRAIERFEAEIARDASDPFAYVNMGLGWHWTGHYARALEQLSLAYALCARASLLATCPDPTCRNGASALVDATAALNIAREKKELTTNWKRR